MPFDGLLATLATRDLGDAVRARPMRADKLAIEHLLLVVAPEEEGDLLEGSHDGRPNRHQVIRPLFDA